MLKRYRLLFLILGIGIGIILTNMIYFIYPPIKYISYSDKEIISKAEDLGMVFIKQSINDDKKTEESKMIEKEFVVKSGDTLDGIAKRLFKSGLIDSERNFRQYAKATGVEKGLRVGKYTISPKFDYETIVRILMKR